MDHTHGTSHENIRMSSDLPIESPLQSQAGFDQSRDLEETSEHEKSSNMEDTYTSSNKAEQGDDNLIGRDNVSLSGSNPASDTAPNGEDSKKSETRAPEDPNLVSVNLYIVVKTQPNPMSPRSLGMDQTIPKTPRHGHSRESGLLQPWCLL